MEGTLPYCNSLSLYVWIIMATDGQYEERRREIMEYTRLELSIVFDVLFRERIVYLYLLRT